MPTRKTVRNKSHRPRYTKDENQIISLIRSFQPSDKYHVEINEDDDTDMIEYYIYNGTELCIWFYINIAARTLSVLQLNRCGNTSGNKNLSFLTAFALKSRCNRIIIEADESSLVFSNGAGDEIHIPLYKLSMLLYGKSWYNKKGFYNEEVGRREMAENDETIRFTVAEWLTQIAEYDSEIMFTRIIDEMNSNISGAIRTMDNTTIREIFAYINYRFTERPVFEELAEYRDYIDYVFDISLESGLFNFSANNLVKNIRSRSRSRSRASEKQIIQNREH